MNELVMGFSQSLELRDRYTAEHSREVLELGTVIAEELGIRVDETLREALLLHDIGKLGIPDHILLKSERLTAEEWEVMKEHAELGAGLLRQFSSCSKLSEIILAHQEYFDGSGYPRGLCGEEIPLYARIIAVADAWHAMIGERPYRSPLSRVSALSELLENRGRQFDPRVVDALFAGLSRRGVISPADLERARRSMRDDPARHGPSPEG